MSHDCLFKDLGLHASMNAHIWKSDSALLSVENKFLIHCKFSESICEIIIELPQS